MSKSERQQFGHEYVPEPHSPRIPFADRLQEHITAVLAEVPVMTKEQVVTAICEAMQAYDSECVFCRDYRQSASEE